MTESEEKNVKYMEQVRDVAKKSEEKEELKESQSIAATTTAAGGVSSNLPSWSVCVSFAPTSFVNIAG